MSPNVPVPHKELAPATMMVTYQFAAVGAQEYERLVDDADTVMGSVMDALDDIRDGTEAAFSAALLAR